MRLHHTAPQAGFSMIELMVALLLGVVLTSGVISVFITSKTSYSLNNAVGQVQEAGRFAMSTVQPIVSQAGYTGCANQTFSGSESGYLNNPTGGPVYEFDYPVYGFEYNSTGPGDSISDTGTATIDASTSDWTPSLTPDLTTALALAVKNSDILVVHEELSNPASILVPYTGDTSTPITYDASATTPGLSAGDIAIASNCNNFTPFQISSSTWAPGGGNGTLNFALSGTPGNTGTWGITFKAASQVGQAQTYVFFVGKSQIDGGYSLFEASLMADNGNTALNGKLTNIVEIVPGVENMQVLYGVDTDTTPADYIPNYYLTAAQVDAAAQNFVAADPVNNKCPGVKCPWNKVVAVRIALVVRSDDNSIPKEQAPTAATSIQMLGVAAADSMDYHPAVDRRIHRYFIETISLRNSLR